MKNIQELQIRFDTYMDKKKIEIEKAVRLLYNHKELHTTGNIEQCYNYCCDNNMLYYANQILIEFSEFFTKEQFIQYFNCLWNQGDYSTAIDFILYHKDIATTEILLKCYDKANEAQQYDILVMSSEIATTERILTLYKLYYENNRNGCIGIAVSMMKKLEKKFNIIVDFKIC